MGIIKKLKSVFAQQARSVQYLAETAAGSDNEQGLLRNKRLLNDRLTQAVDALTAELNLMEAKLNAIVTGSKDELRLSNKRVGAIIALLNDLTNVLRSRVDGVIKGVDTH